MVDVRILTYRIIVSVHQTFFLVFISDGVMNNIFADWVLFHYDDGSYYLRPPADLKPELVKPQQRFIETFKEKEMMEAGMKVRLYWNEAYPVAKATVVSVDNNPTRITGLFDTLSRAIKDKAEKNKVLG